MSRHEYEVSRHIASHDLPFYALIMAAMRQADSNNIQLLSAAFPEVYEELDARYNAPNGYLPTDPDYAEAFGES
jgi:hypothetical protein